MELILSSPPILFWNVLPSLVRWLRPTMPKGASITSPSPLRSRVRPHLSFVDSTDWTSSTNHTSTARETATHRNNKKVDGIVLHFPHVCLSFVPLCVCVCVCVFSSLMGDSIFSGGSILSIVTSCHCVVVWPPPLPLPSATSWTHPHVRFNRSRCDCIRR